MRPVLMICHDPVETMGHAGSTLSAEGLELLRVDTWRPGLAFPDISEVSGVVMFGGEMNVDMTERYPHLTEERDLLKRALDGGTPFLGICLGAQMLARALDVPVVSSPVKEIGFTPVRPTEAAGSDPLLRHLRPMMVYHWHEDTFAQPPGTTLLATADDVPVQAYRVDGVPAWGIQFHFEVDRAEIELWTRDSGPGLAERWGKSGETMLAEADLHLESQEAFAKDVFRDFAQVAREHGA